MRAENARPLFWPRTVLHRPRTASPSRNSCGARNWITPCAELEKEFFPQAQWIIDAIDQKILPLGVDRPAANFSPVEQMRREKAGV